MAKMPKRVKYRKFQRGRTKGKATRGNRVNFGDFGLQALDAGRISSHQIEAGRVAMGHYLRDEGKLTIRIFPHKSVTATPAETRMGTGKGEPVDWVAEVKPGTIIYELGGIPEELIREAFARAAHRMPVRTKMLERRFKV
ncbi:MAG: 50S ribosomal protein L16 [Planctomycetes bacterium]|nr:50S ribosomal protein L16 [Planctomycetota bacterium]